MTNRFVLEFSPHHYLLRLKLKEDQTSYLTSIIVPIKREVNKVIMSLTHHKDETYIDSSGDKSLSSDYRFHKKDSNSIQDIKFNSMTGVGKVLKSLRVERGYNQSQFAQRLNISRSFLSEIEAEKKTPSVQLLQTISDELKIPLAVIFLKAMDKENIAYDNKEEIFEAIKPAIDRIESYFSVVEDGVKTP